MRTTFDFAPLFRSSIGFDRMLDALETASRATSVDNWPPYDIVKTGEDDYHCTRLPRACSLRLSLQRWRAGRSPVPAAEASGSASSQTPTHLPFAVDSVPVSSRLGDHSPRASEASRSARRIAEAWKRWIDYGPVRNLPKCESRPGTTRPLMTRNTGCCGCRSDCRTWSKPRRTRANPAASQNRSAVARSQQKHGPPSVEPPQTSRPLFGPYQPICGRDRQRAHPNRAAQ